MDRQDRLRIAERGSQGDHSGPRAYCGGLTQFSDDGQWWWDGNQWIATSQVVLPKLPMTESDRESCTRPAFGCRSVTNCVSRGGA